MTDVASLGGGYMAGASDPAPTVSAVLDAAAPGADGARLVVIAGPPGVGKTTLARGLCEYVPQSLMIDKDWAAGGFILQAARQAGDDLNKAYGRDEYWQHLRPLEYAGAMTTAAANLLGRRTVLLTGGWGPELGVARLWTGLMERLAPSRMLVLHLDAPPRDLWRHRMAARGSRSDEPWFSQFTRAVTAGAVWSGAHHLSSSGPASNVLQEALHVLSE